MALKATGEVKVHTDAKHLYAHTHTHTERGRGRERGQVQCTLVKVS